MSTCRPRRTRLWLVVAASVSLVVALLATTPAGASSPAGSTAPRQAGTAQLSGTVTDGSGHGWPMYAEITIDGYDGGPIFTNPYTGHYSVDLPAAASYQLHVEAVDMPGYTPADVTVDLGSGGAREDIALIVDAATCTAPGYATTSVGAVTDFERWTGSTPRDGWSITDQSGNGEAWEFDDPGGRGNLTGDDGTFAIVDSGYFGFGTVQNTSLVSPVLDMSDQARPVVELDTAYQWYFGAGVDVDLSVDGGQTWTNVWEHTIPSIVDHLQVPLPDAAEKSAVQVRFHYTGHTNGYWQLDNVLIGHQACGPVEGGLVAGIVTDGNTGEGVDGARVARDANVDEFGVSAATPEDAEVSDGFYWLFSSHTGRTALSVTDGKYTSAGGSVDVPGDYVAHQDWTLAAGHLTVDPGNISVNERMGRHKTRTVTFGNDGTEPVQVRLAEQDDGFTPMGGKHMATAPGAPTTHITGDIVVGSIALHNRTHATSGRSRNKAQVEQLRQPTPYADPWTEIADYPTVVMDNAVAYRDGLVYSVGGVSPGPMLAAGYTYDPSAQEWAPIADMPEPLEKPSANFIGGTLYVAGGWNASAQASPHVYAYDPDTDVWTQRADLPVGLAATGTAVLGGKLYVVGGCRNGPCDQTSDATYVYDPSADSWSQVADYPLSDAWPACAGAGGRVVCAGGHFPKTHERYADTYLYDPDTDAWVAGADLPYTSWGAVAADAGDKLQVIGGVIGEGSSNQALEYDPRADVWAALPNPNNAVYRAGGGCGLAQVGGSTGVQTPNGVDWAEMLPGYTACAHGGPDVPWMSADVSEFDVAPGESVSVRVLLDSSAVSQPGDYLGTLAVRTDAPYRVDPVRVRMQVDPPRSWGKITGTVTDAGSGEPIVGVTVQVCTMFDRTSGSCGPVTYTLTTDADGVYRLWLSKGYNPLEVVAAKDGYQPELTITRIHRGETTTVDFALKKR